eukprot:COSAG01_NODE_2534_length_7489_cov_17.264953_4_plen_92_part_00
MCVCHCVQPDCSLRSCNMLNSAVGASGLRALDAAFSRNCTVTALNFVTQSDVWFGAWQPAAVHAVACASPLPHLASPAPGDTMPDRGGTQY